MTDAVLDNLLALANAYTLTQSVDPVSKALTLTLGSPTGGALPDLVETISTTVVQNVPFNLGFLLKNVRFASAQITDDVPIGGLPISDLLTSGILETDGDNTAKTPGVAGLISGIAGQIPLLVPTLQKTSLDVTVRVHWQIRDENGAPVSDVTTTLGSNPPSQIADIFPAVGQELDPLVVSLLPTLVELTNQLPALQKRTITASINLTATAGSVLNATTGWITLPPVAITLPTIPIPTLAIFYSNNFSGHALVAVPANSPLTQATLISQLNTLTSLLSTSDVFALPSIASALLGLPDVVTDLGKATRIYFKAADGVSDLGNIQLQPTSLGDPTGMNADDDLSSLVYLAAPVRKLQCFNDSGYKSDEGQFTVATSLQTDLLVTIESFKTLATSPPTGVTIDKKPGGYNGRLARNVRSFNDELSSYRFVQTPSGS